MASLAMLHDTPSLDEILRHARYSVNKHEAWIWTESDAATIRRSQEAIARSRDLLGKPIAWSVENAHRLVTAQIAQANALIVRARLLLVESQAILDASMAEPAADWDGGGRR
jgi:hypothetical protein